MIACAGRGGTVHVKEFRALVSKYSSIHGELRLNSECVEVRSGCTNTGIKIDTYLPTSVIKTIAFD